MSYKIKSDFALAAQRALEAKSIDGRWMTGTCLQGERKQAATVARPRWPELDEHERRCREGKRNAKPSQQHYAIWKTIRQKNPDLARQTMLQHIDLTRSELGKKRQREG